MLCLSQINGTPHTIAVCASQSPSPTTTQHSLPSARYGLLGPVSHRLEHASFLAHMRSIRPFEHNFGHGKDNLAMMLAAMNLLAFAFHTICDCLEEQWIKAREAKPARTRFFEHIPTITAYLVFPSWETLMTTLINSKPPPEIEKQMGL